METVKVIIDGLVAIGTLAVAVIAIWGEKVRACLAPTKLRIEAHNLRGDPTELTFEGVQHPAGGIKAMWYHLKVVNRRPWLTAQNCRVLLKGISKRGPDGRFYAVSLTVPLQFVWAPAEYMPLQVTITNEQVFDFGSISEGTRSFVPRLHMYPSNFLGVVLKDEAVRYELSIEASNFTSPVSQIFEVAWDGIWCFSADQMEQHLRITEITV